MSRQTYALVDRYESPLATVFLVLFIIVLTVI